MNKDKILTAAQMAVVADINNMTCDRITALTGGHGMINMSIYAVSNVIAEELLRGGDISMKSTDSRHLPVDDIMRKAIDAAKAAGADAANAGLVAASIMYLCGTAAQVGIPAGNRKLGAMARMIAGVDRCGVAAMPTAKMNNKISGFAAVMAIYRAMEEGKLCSINGRNVPQLVAGGPVYGHSALGEDFVWPEMARNGARIGTQAMLDTMAGAAIHPHPFTAAIYGAAAILEIIHPDAEVPEECGAYGSMSSAYLVGKSAAETAGLPEKLHVKVSGEEYETAKLIGDIGLLLKDIGGVSVIGMMAFDEIFSIFQEGIAGFSGSPINAPLGHIGAYCVIALKMLLQSNGDITTVAKQIANERFATAIDGENAMLCINTITVRSKEISNGPVTQTLIEATEPTKVNAVYRRANLAYEMLSAGERVEVVVRKLDDERLATVENGSNRIFSDMFQKDIKIKFRRIEKGARRTNKLAKKYLSFDPMIDVDITVDGWKHQLDGFVHDLVPKIAKGEREDLAEIAIPIAGAVDDILLSAHTILNATVPAAVAVAMGIATPEEAAKQVESGAYVTLGIPGGKAAALDVGKRALAMIEYMGE
ncbi:MAG TPA: hypothetical protein IAC62_15330 [Candidatus Pelethocola excrementipullorum]|nr:hypothetical protein [Candidatus Pelethocola excrementipullorum]